jgi:hypothetical protein
MTVVRKICPSLLFDSCRYQEPGTADWMTLSLCTSRQRTTGRKSRDPRSGVSARVLCTPHAAIARVPQHCCQSELVWVRHGILVPVLEPDTPGLTWAHIHCQDGDHLVCLRRGLMARMGNRPHANLFVVGIAVLLQYGEVS